VTPKTSHLNAVKRIFKYLKGKPHLGLWYPRESPFDLEAFSDSDYGGSNLDRKSTTGGCQFLGQRLISWQCKKQTIVATSTTEAEYVAAANCCGQVLWVQNQLLDYGFNFMNTKIHIDNESTICIVKNPVYHSKTKHIEIRHHFIRDCYEKKLISVEKIHTDLNVADLLTKLFDGPRFNYLVHVFLCFRLILAGIAWICKFKSGSVNFNTGRVCRDSGFSKRYTLTTNPTIYDSLVNQFWQTATAKTLVDGTLELHVTIDTIVYIITEASIRNKLQLADTSGITMLPNNEFFEGMRAYGLMTMIGDLEKQLKETKQTFGKAILTLVDRVKTLEVALKRKTKRVLLSDSEEEEIEAQGRKTHDLDPLVSLVQELIKSVDKGKRYKRRKSSKEFAGTGLDFEEVKSAFEKVNTGGIRVSVPSPDRGRKLTKERDTREGRVQKNLLVLVWTLKKLSLPLKKLIQVA
ncbi:hypothetical protein Tco_1167894, partial [Tanacetum coccineum]